MDFRGQGKALALAAMLFGMSAAVQAGESRLLYASLGDRDEAFAWLGQSVEKRFPPLIYLGVNPVWDNLRDDPRFPEMLRRVNLSP